MLHSYSLTGDTLITIDIFAAQHGPQIGLELKGRHRKLWASSCLGGFFSASHYVSVCGCIITLNLKTTEQRKTTQAEPGDLEGLSSPWIFNVIMAIWLYRSTRRHACLNLSLPWTQQKVLRLMFFLKHAYYSMSSFMSAVLMTKEIGPFSVWHVPCSFF